MIQYSLLGPEDGDGASPRNVVFKRIDAAVRPRRLYWISEYMFVCFSISLLHVAYYILS
jgi:hypothetical protein